MSDGNLGIQEHDKQKLKFCKQASGYVKPTNKMTIKVPLQCEK